MPRPLAALLALTLICTLPLPAAADGLDEATATLRKLVAKGRAAAERGPTVLVLFGYHAQHKLGQGGHRGEPGQLALLSVKAPASPLAATKLPAGVRLHPDHVQPVVLRLGAAGVTETHGDRVQDHPLVLIGPEGEGVRVSLADGALRFARAKGVDPAPTTAAASVRRQIARAAATTPADLRTITTAAEMPPLATLDARLTTLLVCGGEYQQRIARDLVHQAPKEPLGPGVIQRELAREGYFSAIQSRDVASFSCQLTPNGVATGALATRHEGEMRWTLQVRWRAVRRGDRWVIVRFELPKAKLAVVEGQGGRWAVRDLAEAD